MQLLCSLRQLGPCRHVQAVPRVDGGNSHEQGYDFFVTEVGTDFGPDAVADTTFGQQSDFVGEPQGGLLALGEDGGCLFPCGDKVDFAGGDASLGGFARACLGTTRNGSAGWHGSLSVRSGPCPGHWSSRSAASPTRLCEPSDQPRQYRFSGSRSWCHLPFRWRESASKLPSAAGMRWRGRILASSKPESSDTKIHHVRTNASSN